MKKSTSLLLGTLLFGAGFATAQHGENYNNADFKLTAAQAVYQADLGVLVMSMQVSGLAGRTTPKPIGSTQGAPVLAYVFPTTLKPQDVGCNLLYADAPRKPRSIGRASSGGRQTDVGSLCRLWCSIG